MIHIFLFIINISAQAEYFTNTNYLYEITGKDSIVYCATNGGAVAYNYISDTFEVLTNVDGLQLNKQWCLGLDSSGYVWIGNDLGLALIDQNFSSIQVYPIEYLTSFTIRVVECLKDSIYVGSIDGLLFIDTKGTPDDFTDDSRLTIYETEGLPSNNVRAIAPGDTLVWVGTDEGLVTFKKDFTSHVQYDISDGLLSNVINKIAIIDTSIYVATDFGLNIFRGDHFDTLLIGYEVNDISHTGDSLALALDTLSQIGFFYQGSLTIAKNGLPYKCKVLSLANIDGNLFCGLGNRYSKDYYGEGIGRFDFDNGIWEITKNHSLPSNHITAITANEYGVFVACGARAGESRGIGWLNNNGEWINFTRDSIIPSNHIHRCTTAPDKKVWFGINTFSGSGGDTIMAFSYDPPNNEWNFISRGYNGMENTVAIWDIKFDYHNNMYLAVAGPSDKLWVIDSALNTVYFLGDRIPGYNVEIAIDSTGKIYRTMTGAEGGLIMIDTKNTLFDRSNDSTRKFGVSDGLLSKYALGCIVDKNNILYVANNIGLLIYDGEDFSGITDISEQELFDVELDSEGRVWIMARDGIYYYDPTLNITDGWRFSDLNVHIEFLVFSNEVIQIQGFEFDPIRKCFWIGGETGLLKITIEYDTLPGLDNILVYPNPAVGKNLVKIKNIPIDSRVNIYSISGRLIVQGLLPDEVFGEVVWEIPDDVGSGLYFALIKSNQGSKVCKFAIVR